MVCPNHDASQICPDCTYRTTTVTPAIQNLGRALRTDSATGRITAPVNQIKRELPPLEQHKADLEMIIAACVTGADKTGEAACTSIAKLANGMLVRLDDKNLCPGCFGAGTGARCCICSKRRDGDQS